MQVKVQVELVEPPKYAVAGEKLTFAGYSGWASEDDEEAILNKNHISNVVLQTESKFACHYEHRNSLC
jgi:hypothetical protein